MRAQSQKHQAQAHSASSGLQSQPTTAISLPEGVLAQQQDGDFGPTSSSTSVAGAPSFISHMAPTLDGRGNDVEGMLGEILSMEDGDHGWWGSETGAAGWNGEISVGDMDADELEESSDEERDKEMTEEALIARWRSRKKHYFVLSSAGKPIYTRHGDEKLISGYMGVIQTIVSFFQDNGETLRSFIAGKHHFVVVKEGPLYLVAISSLGESDGQLRAQLDALYNQVISTLTVPSLTKVFSQREGYDLRRLLGGTEVFLDGLSDAMTRGDPATLLSSLECIKLRKTHREKINAALLKYRVPTLLYGLIVADGRLVSVVRPKRHSLYPPDLQLLFSMLFNAYTFRDGGEHWIPICLPKFNSRGYLHAYICFFRPEISIVLISAEKDTFFELRTMKEQVVEHLDSHGLTPLIEASLQQNRYSVTDILTPDQKVLHFLYKSRANVQFTMPAYEPHFYTPLARRRLMTVYQRLHAAVHAKQGGFLKVHYARGEGWSTLAWVTQTWELYVVAGGGVERKSLAEAAGRVVRWVDREEERCFVVGGAVF
ncbi:trafficking protein Mon1-domain-containing protein [Peziza echinospora]|nr:trafficking protein Mon1-domain-containing protein [Peziza echinospora]